MGLLTDISHAQTAIFPEKLRFKRYIGQIVAISCRFHVWGKIFRTSGINLKGNDRFQPCILRGFLYDCLHIPGACMNGDFRLERALRGSRVEECSSAECRLCLRLCSRFSVSPAVNVQRNLPVIFSCDGHRSIQFSGSVGIVICDGLIGVVQLYAVVFQHSAIELAYLISVHPGDEITQKKTVFTCGQIECSGTLFGQIAERFDTIRDSDCKQFVFSGINGFQFGVVAEVERSQLIVCAVEIGKIGLMR